MTELSAVGNSVTRLDALDKVTGAAKYNIDEGIGLAQMLYAKALFSPHAHAKILSVDTSKAERVPGVRAIMTGKDVNPYRSGEVIADRHILCRGKVRFVGDAVAAVAAESIEAAEEALDLIRVEYEELPAIFDPEEAMKPDCPVVVHPDLARYDRPSFAYLGRDLPAPNVHTHHKVRRGNVEDGFRKADLIVENRFSTPKISHCRLELSNAVAYVEDDGSLTVWTKGPIFRKQMRICQEFGLPRDNVRMRLAYVGGGFGASGETERFAILLALKTQRPVKLVYTRKETFIDGYSRTPTITYIKDGVKSDGTLVAREMKVIINTGAYTHLAPITIRNGSFHASAYRIPNFRWDAYGVYTNEKASGPYRGFGNSEVLWAVESQMDIIAEKLQLDPVELRKKNLIREGEENLRGEITHSIGAEECLDKVAQWWRKPSSMPTGNWKTGKGIALGNKYTQVEVAASAMVKVHRDGTVEVLHGSEEHGQGCNTVMAQIAAEEFKIPVEKVRVVWGDTAIEVYDAGAISSKTTLVTGKAVCLACQDAKRQIFEIAAPKLETAPQDLDIRDGKVYIKRFPGKALTIADLFAAEGAGEIVGKGHFRGEPSGEDPETGQGKALTVSYCYVAQAAEVAVDVETGVVKVSGICTASDVGRAINPRSCEGQMEGGAAQGIGSALFEENVFDKKGKLVNPDFTDYKVPCTLEVPSGDDIKSMIVEAPHKDGPFGAKGMGEAAMTATAPAIANAIYNAVGVRLKDLPLTPERVLKALRKIKA